MMSCEGCEEYHYRVIRLEDIIENLHKELLEERKKTSNYESVKRERDEMKKTLNRSYDLYVTDPQRRD
jgi:two-component SAPR family response regulator